jgi:hypothetical protein
VSAEPDVTVAAIRARLEAWNRINENCDGPEQPGLITDVAFLLAENARKDAIVEQVPKMIEWLDRTYPDQGTYALPDVVADLLEAIMAGDTDRLPWSET